ncbi:MAG TPA: hypothetical protein PK379_02550 [Candidatus Hydrogenedentes bacterium]|nr:hypothetical protein [Candidatus Hydrogenedentota bacterium]HOK88886.1 hypothetical protein [Candidatus Hydrogenedentota bacterium]
MKHVRLINRTSRATAFEDTVCQIVYIFNAVLGFFGGASPLGQFLQAKCNYEIPELIQR